MVTFNKNFEYDLEFDPDARLYDNDNDEDDEFFGFF